MSQETAELDKIDQIEKEITVFYEEMGDPEKAGQDAIEIKQETMGVQDIPKEIYQKAILQQQTHETQQQTTLQKEQVRVMNENISKFLIVYKEKDKAIEEKNRAIDERNKSIYILQQKLSEAEERIKKLMIEHQNGVNKDNIIEERTKTIQTLQQRLQEVENKFNKIALLHKSIVEKEQFKDSIIEEKNKFIISLQDKLSTIEAKLQEMISINEDSKENIFGKKLLDIDEKIQSERRKNRIFIILFIFFLFVAI